MNDIFLNKFDLTELDLDVKRFTTKHQYYLNLKDTIKNSKLVKKVERPLKYTSNNGELVNVINYNDEFFDEEEEDNFYDNLFYYETD